MKHKRENVWAQIDRMAEKHAADVKRTAEALTKLGWTGPEIDTTGLWAATLRSARYEDGEPIRVTARTSTLLLRRVRAQQELLDLV